MYEYISVENINMFKSILKNAASNKKIEINIPSMELSFRSDSLSTTLEEDKYFNGMDQVYLLNQDNSSVLRIKEREYEVFFNLGECGYEARVPKSHLVLGTHPIKFGSDYFCQIELSQVIEDDEYI